jgi:hypothetical protein
MIFAAKHHGFFMKVIRQGNTHQFHIRMRNGRLHINGPVSHGIVGCKFFG